MKLFVQARKDGYNVLYPKPTPTEFFEFAGDIRPNGSSENLLGKYIYTIAFATGGCIFTKHVVVKDTLRSALGNIGFSIFIPNIKKLSGDNVIKLLDELLKTYCEKYCPDYFLENKTEDWAFFEEIKNQYKPYDLSNDDTENYQHGNADAAFVYYIDKTELCKFFDNPYQEEYSKYKQVFFVEKNLEDKSDNPLKAIPHDPNANLTGGIDLENLKYTLVYNQPQQAKGGVKIEVKVNGKLRYSKNKIKIKGDLQITWSKQFCKEIYKEGKWDKIGSDFLIINHIEKTISVKEIDLDPIKHTFTIQTKDRYSIPITDAKITLKVNNYLSKCEAINNSIQITAEQLHNKCSISAEQGNLFSPQHEIKLEDKIGSISLILSEPKKVKFTVQTENGLESNYSIQISNKTTQPKDGEVEFIGDEIDAKWQILVSLRDYETEHFVYHPAKDENPRHVHLNKKTSIGTGQQTGAEKPKEGISTKSPVQKAPKLWYSKVPRSVWIFLIIAIVTSGVFLLIKPVGNEGVEDIAKTKISNKINSYVDGIDLNRDTLNEYKRKHCHSTTFNQSDIKEKSWWQKLWPFGSDEESKTINESTGIPEYFSKIDNAIAIRNAIDLGKIDTLKTMKFSENQKNFNNAIDSIVDKYKDKIGATLKADTVSRMNLNQVAALILKTQEDFREKEIAIQKEKEPVKKTNQDKQNEQKSIDQKKNNNQNQQNSQTQNQQSSGNSLKNEFWNLVHSGNAKMESYSNLLKKPQSKDGDIIAYLNKICKNSASFKKFKDIPEMDRKSAKTLTEIDIK